MREASYARTTMTHAVYERFAWPEDGPWVEVARFRDHIAASNYAIERRNTATVDAIKLGYEVCFRGLDA